VPVVIQSLGYLGKRVSVLAKLGQSGREPCHAKGEMRVGPVGHRLPTPSPISFDGLCQWALKRDQSWALEKEPF